MGITDSDFIMRHQPRFWVQILAAGLLMTLGYAIFSIWDNALTRTLGGLLMTFSMVNLLAMIYAKLQGGKDYLKKVIEEEAKQRGSKKGPK